MAAGKNDSVAPEWFERAIDFRGEIRSVSVEGCPIHYRRWGDPDRPGLLLVPVSGGHVNWYAHLAPYLADQLHFAVVDLSGCGDSGRRDRYSKKHVISEIEGVLCDSGMFDADCPPTIIGHSAGAQCVIRAAQVFGERLLGAIAVDGLRYAELETDHAIKALSGPRPAPRPPRVYPDLEEAVARFRLMPPPKVEIGNAFIVEHIARNSFRQVEGGWTSKFDPAQAGVIDLAFELTGALKDLPCRAASLYAEHSHLTDASAGDTVTRMNEGKVTAFTIPGTSHYPPIDSPFAFVAAIKGIVLTWLAELNRAS